MFGGAADSLLGVFNIVPIDFAKPSARADGLKPGERRGSSAEPNTGLVDLHENMIRKSIVGYTGTLQMPYHPIGLFCEALVPHSILIQQHVSIDTKGGLVHQMQIVRRFCTIVQLSFKLTS